MATWWKARPSFVLVALLMAPAVLLLRLYPAVSVQHITEFAFASLQSQSQIQLDLNIFLGYPDV